MKYVSMPLIPPQYYTYQHFPVLTDTPSVDTSIKSGPSFVVAGVIICYISTVIPRFTAKFGRKKEVAVKLNRGLWLIGVYIVYIMYVESYLGEGNGGGKSRFY